MCQLEESKSRAVGEDLKAKFGGEVKKAKGRGLGRVICRRMTAFAGSLEDGKIRQREHDFAECLTDAQSVRMKEQQAESNAPTLYTMSE